MHLQLTEIWAYLSQCDQWKQFQTSYFTRVLLPGSQGHYYDQDGKQKTQANSEWVLERMDSDSGHVCPVGKNIVCS